MADDDHSNAYETEEGKTSGRALTRHYATAPTENAHVNSAMKRVLTDCPRLKDHGIYVVCESDREDQNSNRNNRTHTDDIRAQQQVNATINGHAES